MYDLYRINKANVFSVYKCIPMFYLLRQGLYTFFYQLLPLA
jgi:hypothetical protein